MNSSKNDYKKLYLLQDKFLSWWVTLGLPFYLTGGTALGRFYLNQSIIQLSVNYSFNWQDIFSHAKQKAVINELDVEKRLVSFPVEWLETVNWLNAPIHLDSTKKILNQIADDFLLGKPNSLGTQFPPIETAKHLQ